MIQREITIINKLGLHARAAAKFVQLASQFQSTVELIRDGKRVSGKSILGVMMLAASRHTRLDLVVYGDDEIEATRQLVALINRRFGEEE